MKAMKFRNSFFGGFNKSDVMKYIEELQKEKSKACDTAYDKAKDDEIIALKEENDRLVLALEKANEQIKKLADPIEGSNKMIANSIDYSKAHFESIANLADNIRNETAENISTISGDVSGMTKVAQDIAKDFESAIKKLNGDLDGFKKYLANSSEYFEKQNTSTENIRYEVDAEDKNIMEILSQGYELLDETNLDQLEISKIIDDLKTRYE